MLVLEAANPSADAYAKSPTPLLVSPGLEGHGGAMFNRKGEAILSPPGLTDSQMNAFIAASEALVSRDGCSRFAITRTGIQASGG